MPGALIRMTNSVDDHAYRASVIQRRKYVKYIRQGLVPGTKELNTIGMTAEAAIVRGRWILLRLLSPRLVVCYVSDLPPRLPFADFCDVIRVILSACDIEVLRSGEKDATLKELCRRHSFLADLGIRYSILPFRRVPHLFLLDHHKRDQ